VDDAAVLEVLTAAAEAVHRAADALDDWGLAGTRPGQYKIDLAADAAALEVLHGAGLAVVSEESGRTGGGGELVVVLDPIDGSTNAAHGIPWYATSLCALDDDGARVALVVNQATGERFEAVRGGGARRNGVPIKASGCTDLSHAIVGITGFPRVHPGWAQFRALGAAALELCAVASGSLDGFVAIGGSWLHGWDYLGGMLVCTEAGAVVGELHGESLIVRDTTRRAPIAAATDSLFLALSAGLGSDAEPKA
jgi:fructose-1,6-bisphosphatase/inositol monophosphatase family enzyme